MKLTRRTALALGAAAPLVPAAKVAEAMKARVLKTGLSSAPVRIESIELMKNGKNYFVRARSKDGAVGYADAHSSVMSAAYPILIKKVAPVLVGKDAHDLESLLDEVYLANSNYKWQGLPFWVSVACAEIAILDLLGKTVNKPMGELFRQRDSP